VGYLDAGCYQPLFRALKVLGIHLHYEFTAKILPLGVKNFDSVVLKNLSRPADIAPYENQSTIQRSQK
jgi:hypothetical protein